MNISVIHKLILRSWLISLVFVSFSSYANHCTENKNDIDTIFFHIYNQQFNKAELELNQSKNKLKPLSYNLLTTDLIWWKTLSSNNEGDFEILENDLTEKLSNVEKLSSQNNLDELLYLNYLLRLTAINNQPFRMLNYFIRINKFIETFDNSDLSVEEQNIFDIFKAVFNVSKSKVLIIGAGFKNDNIKILKGYQESSSLINKTIACYFLGKIYFEIEKSPEYAVEYYSKLCHLYPNNMIFKNELLAVQLKIHQIKYFQP